MAAVFPRLIPRFPPQFVDYRPTYPPSSGLIHNPFHVIHIPGSSCDRLARTCDKPDPHVPVNDSAADYVERLCRLHLPSLDADAPFTANRYRQHRVRAKPGCRKAHSDRLCNQDRVQVVDVFYEERRSGSEGVMKRMHRGSGVLAYAWPAWRSSGSTSRAISSNTGTCSATIG